jgi:hypothetical protein
MIPASYEEPKYKNNKEKRLAIRAKIAA